MDRNKLNVLPWVIAATFALVALIAFSRTTVIVRGAEPSYMGFPLAKGTVADTR